MYICATHNHLVMWDNAA